MSPHEKIMALLQEAMALAPEAGLYLKIKIEARDPVRKHPSDEERARRRAGPASPKLGPL